MIPFIAHMAFIAFVAFTGEPLMLIVVVGPPRAPMMVITVDIVVAFVRKSHGLGHVTRSAPPDRRMEGWGWGT